MNIILSSLWVLNAILELFGPSPAYFKILNIVLSLAIAIQMYKARPLRPLEPVYLDKDGWKQIIGLCPNCAEGVRNDRPYGHSITYCSRCGQVIEWQK